MIVLIACIAILVALVFVILLIMSAIFGESAFYIDNAIVLCGGLFAHMVAEQLLLPIIWSPRRFYSGVIGTLKYPWEPPGFAVRVILVPIIMFFFMQVITSIALQMKSLRQCRKKDQKTALTIAALPSQMAIGIYFLVSIIPIFKLPVILMKDKIPFAENIMFGLPMALALFAGYYISQSIYVDSIC